MPISAHLIILPILLPMAAGAVLLLLDEKRYQFKALISLVSVLLTLIISLFLCREAALLSPKAYAYQLGNWPAPFGINLLLDRLSALMISLVSVLALASLLFARAYWQKAGPRFHVFIQFFISGLNGVFLTGDLFNLFVFFEIMLTASYALALHGAGIARTKAGLHYVVVNLVASVFFLLGTALVYGSLGTLNFADIAQKIPTLQGTNQSIFTIGATLLGIAFLTKAAMWPLNFWLVPTYSAASAPAACFFAILSKVGIYTILRLTLLCFRTQNSTLAHFGQSFLYWGGLATLIFGFIGVLASQNLGRLASYHVLVSSGTLLMAIGLNHNALLTGILFYLISSTLALAAFFLLVELIERGQDTAANVLAITQDVYGEDEEEPEIEVGTYIPGTIALLGASFGIVAILLIGMPPLSGFLGKFMLFNQALTPQGLIDAPGTPRFQDWLFVILILLSGFLSLIALSRAGIRIFWAAKEGIVPRVQVIEFAPIVDLIFLCALLSIAAGSVVNYLDALSHDVQQPQNYIHSVLSLEETDP